MMKVCMAFFFLQSFCNVAAVSGLSSLARAQRRLRSSRQQAGDPQTTSSSEDFWAGMKKRACLTRLAAMGMPEMKTASEIFEEASGGGALTKVYESEPDSEGKTKRLLAFQSSEGACNPQAGMRCRRAPGLPAALLQRRKSRKGDHDGDDGLSLGPADSCAGNVCDPDVEASVQGAGGGYLRSMLSAISRLDQPPSRAFSIGLGAGALNTWLQWRYPMLDQTVAELSSSVADTASCFGMPSSVKVEVADGRQVLEAQADGSLDLLFVDAFDAEHDDVPACLMTQEFFQTAAKKLRPGGVLSMNLHTAHGVPPSDDVNVAGPSAQTAFPEVSTGTCPGLANKIMVAQTATNSSSSSGPAGQQTGMESLFQQKARGGDDELNGWWVEANYAALPKSTEHPATSDATSCSR